MHFEVRLDLEDSFINALLCAYELLPARGADCGDWVSSPHEIESQIALFVVHPWECFTANRHTLVMGVTVPGF